MESHFNFWTPTAVKDLTIQSANHLSSFPQKVKNRLIKLGEWADKITYIGQHSIEVKLTIQEQDYETYSPYLLKGRAKKLLINKEISKNEDTAQKPNSLKNAFKVCAIIALFPFLFATKAAYKYLYVQSHFEKELAAHESKTLNHLLEKYPDDPDLKSLDLCQQYHALKKEMKDQGNAFSYLKLKALIQDIQHLLLQFPEHQHAKELLKNILEIENHPLLNIQDEKEWFDFVECLVSLPISSFPDSFSKLFRMLETDKDKANFKLLIKNYIRYMRYGGYPSSNFPQDASAVYIAIITQLNFKNKYDEKEYIDLLNWLLDKADAENQNRIFVPSIRHTLLQIFYSHGLPRFKKPYTPELIALESRMINLDNGFAREFRERMLLALLFGLKGMSSIDPITFRLGGFRQETGILKTESKDLHINSQLNEYVYPILQDTMKQLEQTDEHTEWLNQLNQMFSKDGIPEFDAHLCVNQTDISSPHAWSQVRYKEYLLIGNQGYGCGDYPGVLVFKINPLNFDPKNSTKFKITMASEPTASRFKKGFDKKFLKQDYFQNLDAEFIGHLRLPLQKVGNCPWKAVKLNLFSAMFALNAYDDLKAGKSFKKIEKNLKPVCNQFKKDLTQPIREKLLENYIKRHADGSYPREPDEKLLETIYKKAKKKNWTSICKMLENRS